MGLNAGKLPDLSQSVLSHSQLTSQLRYEIQWTPSLQLTALYRYGIFLIGDMTEDGLDWDTRYEKALRGKAQDNFFQLKIAHEI